MNSSSADPTSDGHVLTARTWKAVALILLGGASGSVVEKLSPAVERDDVAEMIADGVGNSPYARDSRSIELRLMALERVSEQVPNITRALTKLETKIDVLLETRR
jgi:hypothetical protein